MQRFFTQVLLLLAAVLTLTAAFPPRNGGGLSKLLVERQLTSPPPPDFLSITDPQNISVYDDEKWLLSTTTLIQNHYQTQPYVANGYHGSRVPAEGMGYWRERNATNPVNGQWPINGWPLDNARQTVSTISGFWDSQRNTTRTNFPELLDHGGESVISGIPTWSTIYVTTADGKHTYRPGVDVSRVSNFYQSLSIKNGILTTNLTWTPVRGVSYNLSITLIAHRSRINLGMMKLEITPSGTGNVIVTDILDGEGAQRTAAAGKAFEPFDDLIWTSVKPTGVDNVTAYEFSTLAFPFGPKQGLVREDSRRNARDRSYVSSNDSTISQEYMIETSAGQTVTVLKYVGIASSDAFPDDPKAVARCAAFDAKRDGWDVLVEEHEAAWQELWDDGDVIIHGDEELQISVRASLFHLLSNVRSGDEGSGIGDNSISVGGLTSDSYAGLVFWDADLWMLPGLLAIHPEHAAAINNYRFRLLPQAIKNAGMYGHKGAMYPWTSARFGNCTGTGPCKDYQYHLNNDIALVHWHQFLTTGDKHWLEMQAWPIIKNVAEFWGSKVERSNETAEDGLEAGMYIVKNMTDPDEYANHVDNGAYTNAGVKVIMGIAQQAAMILGYTAPKKWKDIENNIFIPYNYDAGLVPEFGNMNGSVEIKQADVVLMNYPLEFRLNESQALSDLDFYARAQSPDGPAMTWAMFAIGAAELSPAGCASYTYFIYASQPYLREPYYQFSEQMNDDIFENGNTNPAFTFLTGHGGFLQIPTHGFTGYRPRIDAFYLDPSLPPQLEGVEVKGMKHQGAVFNVFVGPTNTTITRLQPRKPPSSPSHSLPMKIRIGSRNFMAGDYNLSINQSLTIPTTRADLNGTDLPGNKAQCKKTSSPSTFAPGQFPLSAVDGSNQTAWQPSTPSKTSLIVDLGSPQNITGVSLNWGSNPARKWSIHAANESLAATDNKGWKQLWKASRVGISAPWNEEDALKVRIRTGNVTVQDFGEGWMVARWVMLGVEGSMKGKGRDGFQRGATVAEFGIL